MYLICIRIMIHRGSPPSTKILDRHWFPHLTPSVAKRSAELGPFLAQRLREAREASGLTVRALATEAGTTPTTIQAIASGKGAGCSVALLTDIARALHVRPAWLVFGDGEP